MQQAGGTRTKPLLVGVTVLYVLMANLISIWVWPGNGVIFVLIPVLVAITIPILWRASAREDDPSLFWLLLIALVAHFAGSAVRLFVGEVLYGGLADASVYHKTGLEFSQMLREGQFAEAIQQAASYFGGSGEITDLTLTRLMQFLPALVYSLTGPSILASFLFFTWLSFLGLVCFYRAFVISAPEGNRGLHRALVFFLPSLLFWPSSLGKDSWMLFTLGVASLGAARFLVQRKGRPMMILGALGAGLIRPEIAGFFVLAVAGAWLIGRHPKPSRFTAMSRTAAAAGSVLLVILVFFSSGSLLAAIGTDNFQAESFTAALEGVAEQTTIDGSEFEPAVVTTPGRFPLAVFTVLYRPHLFEVDSSLMFFTSLETGFLLVLTLFRLPHLANAVRGARDQPYVALALVFTVIFIIGLSAFGNFGLLARQRVQVLPYLAVLLTASNQPAVRQAPSGVLGRGARSV